MKRVILTVTENRPLTASVYKMSLSGDTSAVTGAGQFVNLAVEGFYLRRPVSVCDRADGILTLIYKTVLRKPEKNKNSKVIF